MNNLDSLADKILAGLDHKNTAREEALKLSRLLVQHASKTIRAVPEVALLADAEDLAPLYRLSSAVVVPLKSGGGTKFKTLEAFLHSRPVISTAHGVRGLTVTAGEHYWPAERPEEFAAACAALAADERRALALARAGQALVLHKYHCEA